MIKSNLPLMIKNVTCAVTGHRTVSEDFDFEKLKKDLEKIIQSGYSYFLTGMAQGFDLLCFNALLSLKEKYSQIKICAVIPCLDQSKYYNYSEKANYQNLLSQADFVASEERTYFKGCMLLRNNFLIDNCSLLYAYFNGVKSGGTYYTINRANKNSIKVIYYGETK